MWRQSYVLIHGSTKAPPELWTVARDLWALRMSTLVDQLDNQAQVVADGDVIDTVNEDSSGSEFAQAEERMKQTLTPKLWDTISLVYLAAILIRCPISLSRIYDLIRSEELAFIRAIRLVPYEMTSHLPPEYQLALDTITIPQIHELQQATFQFIQSFASTFDMEIPALNWRILLYEWIVELGLPLEVYNTVKALTKLVAYDFAYKFQSKVAQNLKEESKKRRRRTPIAMPELQLVSLIVVATKLLFPFPIPPISRPSSQGHGLHTSSTEPSRNALTELSLDWSTWLALHKSNPSPKSFAQKHIETTDRDVLQMSPEEMDDYISWYQRTFTTPDSILRQKKTDLEMSILDMLPAPTPPATISADTSLPSASDSDQSETNIKTSLCQKIQTSALKYTPAATSAPSTPAYPIFSSVEILRSTDTFFKASNDEDEGVSNPIVFFYELAAKFACTDLKTLVKAVRYTEAQLEKWIDKKYREDAGMDNEDGEGEGNDEEMPEAS